MKIRLIRWYCMYRTTLAMPGIFWAHSKLALMQFQIAWLRIKTLYFNSHTEALRAYSANSSINFFTKGKVN